MSAARARPQPQRGAAARSRQGPPAPSAALPGAAASSHAAAAVLDGGAAAGAGLEGDAEAALREALRAALLELDARGLNRGSSGNLSHRWGQGLLISPTGMGAAEVAAADFVWLGFDGTRRGRLAPSSEWHLHLALYRARADLNAIVHTHAPHATALACLRRDLPAFHYMVAVAGGDSVRCAPYRLFGTEALSDVVLQAMQERKACLLATHGAVSAGASLREAMKVMLELESLCQTYLAALAVGEPAVLSGAEMAQVIDRFRSYGQGPQAASPEPG